MFAKDYFHLSHKGFRVLWDRMGTVYPEILRLDFKFCAGIYEGEDEPDEEDPLGLE
jgi:hypothetical protein